MMRLTKRKIVSGALVLAATLLLGLGVAGFAQDGPGRGFDGRGGGPRGGHRGPHGRGGFVPFLRDLNLTDAQKAQVKQITDSFEASTKPLWERMEAQRGGEMDALKDGAFDEAAVRAAAQERANAHVELEVARARMMSQVYALLTPEQKAQIAQRRQQFEQKRQEWKDKHAGKPDDDDQ
jgi:periplasmic protein CpxP/Spy